ncbi:RNA polymerase subunit sigma-70 [Desulforamulus profundi]|uniref:RNA polymerase subunit sigma-70 n=1 Tax=Desulforamulus profundi TaxID=1383067 RepID=A0A2C6MF91_9FIRM|nr:sigma-70 family RNA polymerase sigma factor [Desulforamulus profundi]PHJ38063.1 RNA polymerase subunit sigma-70 [Desulforamulus profundi]
MIDILGTDPEVVSDMVETAFEKNHLMEKVRRLTSREKRVLEMRFGLGTTARKTQREIARALGISRSYVSRIEKRALNKLTKEFRMEGCQ